MAEESKTPKKYDLVRCRPNHKERIEAIVNTKRLRTRKKVTEISLVSEILEKELPKYERKLGIA